ELSGRDGAGRVIQPVAATHVALLRGINVGGKNVIPMSALKSCFEDAGATDVATLIASGNVVFKPSPGSGAGAVLTRSVEALLRERFKTYDARAAVLTRRQVKAVV